MTTYTLFLLRYKVLYNISKGAKPSWKMWEKFGLKKTKKKKNSLVKISSIHVPGKSQVHEQFLTELMFYKFEVDVSRETHITYRLCVKLASPTGCV